MNNKEWVLDFDSGLLMGLVPACNAPRSPLHYGVVRLISSRYPDLVSRPFMALQPKA